MALDIVIAYRNVRTRGNPVSHETECRECQHVVRHSHRIGVGLWHVVGSVEMHEVSLGVVPACTCMHGRNLRPGRAAHCYHVDSARQREEDYISGWFMLEAIQSGGNEAEPEAEMFEGAEQAATITSLTPYELFEEPDGAGEPEPESEPAPVSVLDLLTPPSQSTQNGLLVVEHTEWRYYVEREKASRIEVTVRRDQLGWKCSCDRNRQTEATYCKHILAVLKHRGE